MFNQRPPGPIAKYGLPHRVISRRSSNAQSLNFQESWLNDPADGLCAIEINGLNAMVLGNEGELRRAAASIIRDCVEGSGRGGVIAGGMIERHTAACSAINPAYC